MASTFINELEPETSWHAGFPGKTATILVNSKKIWARTRTRAGSTEESYCEVLVRPGETCTA
jgi:hypothetical protein